MKKITLSLILSTLLFTGNCLGQINHTVSTAGMSFSPSSLTINANDTVTFICTSGTHNVNGTQATFPNNPESFGNTLGSGWTYQHVFSISGEYDFQCDPHSSIMKGKITVQNNTSTQHHDSDAHSNIFPNPFQNELAVQGCNGGELFLYSVVGRLELNHKITNDNYKLTTIDLPSGIYLYQITLDNMKTVSGKIVKK